MKQVTLHHYFESTHKPRISTSRLSFLDLPYDVRYYVYVLAGLVRDCSIDLNSDPAVKDEDRLGCFKHPKRIDYGDVGAFKCFNRSKVAMEEEEWMMAARDCSCEPLPYRLLYVSRVISAEVLSILYSENKFRICRTKPKGLLYLQRLGPKALASVSSLCVSLNAYRCFKDNEDLLEPRHVYDNCIDHPVSRHDKSSSRISRDDRSVISEWSRLCGYIGAHISQSQMRLTLLCDTVNYKMAKEVVKPLLGLPTLKDCSIRLGQRPCHKRRRLAELTIARVTGRTTDYLETVFRFTDLPEEIQQHILGYTDLIAPGELLWDSVSGLAPSIYCDSYSEAPEVCCCPLKHAAFTAKCRCWRMPYEKFQVSHKMREDAIRIFYSSNHFVIQASGSTHAYSTRIPSHVGPSQFLPRFPQRAFGYLRSIRWLFPTDFGTSLCPDENLFQDWLDTIDIIAHSTDVSRLRLTLDMANDMHSTLYAYWSGFLNNTSEAAMWGVYQRLTEPMIALKGLQDLFVHLAWPLGDLKQDLRDQQERILERRVMGEHYDSASRGKVSTWSWEDGSL